MNDSTLLLLLAFRNKLLCLVTFKDMVYYNALLLIDEKDKNVDGEESTVMRVDVSIADWDEIVFSIFNTLITD